MSAASGTIVSYHLGNLHLLRCSSKIYSLNPYRALAIPNSKHGSSFLSNQGLSLDISRRIRCKSDAKMDVTVNSSVQPGAPIPPSNSWKSWILGTLLSIILPFWKHKWAPLLAMKREVDNIVESIDTVVEIVETVAEEVERVADEVVDKLPEGGKLKEIVCFVEQAAKKVAEDAHATDELIHRVEEVEKEVEKEVESLTEMVIMDEENVETREASQEK